MLIKARTLIIGFFILLIIHFVSRFIVQQTGLLLPSPLLGLILFTILLHFKLISKHLVQDICDILLKNMGLLFVPLLVGFIKYYHLIKKDLFAISLIVVFSTFLTMILTALFVENVIKFIRLKRINGYKKND